MVGARLLVGVFLAYLAYFDVNFWMFCQICDLNPNKTPHLTLYAKLSTGATHFLTNFDEFYENSQKLGVLCDFGF